MKMRSNFKNFTIKIISAKGSTNSEIFTGFGRDHRMGWRLLVDTPITVDDYFLQICQKAA